METQLCSTPESLCDNLQRDGMNKYSVAMLESKYPPRHCLIPMFPFQGLELESSSYKQNCPHTRSVKYGEFKGWTFEPSYNYYRCVYLWSYEFHLGPNTCSAQFLWLCRAPLINQLFFPCVQEAVRSWSGRLFECRWVCSGHALDTSGPARPHPLARHLPRPHTRASEAVHVSAATSSNSGTPGQV